MRTEVREPQAGIWGFYPINKDKLVKEIENSFKNSSRGPGQLPQKKLEGRIEIVGGIVPHAGYTYSGACASWFYKELSENIPQIDLAIIIGTNHTGFGGNITTTSYFTEWITPLGSVDVDIEFITELKKAYRSIEDDAIAHLREHSVEVQLPFLQFIYDRFKIVPIVVKDIDYDLAKSFAKVLYEIVLKSGKRCVIIASSDFTHHGSIYGYIIYEKNISDNVRNLDMMFIDKILKFDTRGFLELVHNYNATICGYGAIAIVTEYARYANCEAKFLKYYHSGDVTGEEDIIVGYASIEFYRLR